MAFSQMITHTSVVNPSYTYTDNQWLISIISTRSGTGSGGHSALVVEGLERGSSFFSVKKFIGHYDITAVPLEEQTSSINTAGYITNIRCFENEANTCNYAAKKYPVQTFAVPRNNAKDMIIAIKQDQSHTEKAIANWKIANPQYKHRDSNNNIIEPLQYLYLSHTHPLVKFFRNTDKGYNCTSWCIEKLTENAGIDYHPLLPKPKFASRQCVIL